MDDRLQITRIYSHAAREAPISRWIRPAATRWRTTAPAYWRSACPILAEQHDEVVSYPWANALSARPAYHFTVEDSIDVAASHPGNGCGTALLAPVIEQCEQGPWHQMIATIGDSGNHSSIHLHRHFDFRDVGTLRDVGSKFDHCIGTVLMQRELRAR